MSEAIANEPGDSTGRRANLPAVLLLFVGSGCAALIYEIVWFQLLEFVIGSSAISLGVLLGTYMGGMCLGSLLLARVVSVRAHPLRVYAALEMGIGLCGIVVLFLVPQVALVYAAHVGHGLVGLLLRGLVCAICLLPPTLLMGATLPAISRWVEATPRGISWLGFFYGGNLAGAVTGSLLAGFYLLRVHDMTTATFVAATINVLVALVGFALAARSNFGGQPVTSGFEDKKGARGASLVYVAIALSGMCALGAEVVWTRLLSLLLGATVYTFSIILAVFLVGLGVGSSLGSLAARKSENARAALGFCQLLLVFGMGWSAYMLSCSLPNWPINPSLTNNPWLVFQLDLVRCFWAILPPAILWGASFPLALAAVVRPGQDPGRLVGKVYAANTVGAIAGAVGMSVLFIGWMGTRQAQQTLIALAGVAALLLLTPAFWSVTRAPADRKWKSGAWGIAVVVCLLLVAGIAGLIVRNVPGVPWQLVAHGRYLPTYKDNRQLVYLGEGLNASVAVTQLSDGVRNFHVSGKVEASTDSEDMRLQRMLGHIPALLHPGARSVLVVGCGAGVTAGSFTVYTNIERIVICEIEPLIPREVTKYFRKENYAVVEDPRVEIVLDDARHFILTTKEKFDIITSDPIHPWVKGAASLYTREYFEMVKRHLKPGGLVTQWVPLYESNSGVVRSEVATFFSVFPAGTIWGNDSNGEGYDTVLLGSADPVAIHLDEAQQRMEQNHAVAQSLHDVGIWSAIGLFARYAGRAEDLGPWLDGAEINRDRNLRLQYLAGLASNLYDEGNIYNEILYFRKFPEELFSGSPESRIALKDAIK